MQWTPDLDEPGMYEVLIYVPPLRSTTNSARYMIQHEGAQDTVVVAQRDHRKEWVSLGEYAFSARGEEFVRLSDVTGEATDSTTIGFDVVRLVRLRDTPAAFDAEPATSIPDVVLAHPGEQAQLSIETRNSGRQVWKAGQVTLRNVKKPLGAPSSQALLADNPPGGSATWTLTVTAPNAAGVTKSVWQLAHQTETFGPELSAYLIVIPAGKPDLEKEIREIIDEWRQRGEEKTEELLKEIERAIAVGVERFWQRLWREIQEAVSRWLSDACGSAGLAVVGVPAAIVARKRRRQTRAASRQRGRSGVQ